MDRELIWVEKERFQGWACAACAWEFKSSGPLVGDTLDEMKRNYEGQRDEESRRTFALNIRSCLPNRDQSLGPFRQRFFFKATGYVRSGDNEPSISAQGIGRRDDHHISAPVV